MSSTTIPPPSPPLSGSLSTPSTQCTTSAVFTFRARDADAVIWFDDAAACHRRCHPGCFLVVSGDGDVVSTGTGRGEMTEVRARGERYLHKSSTTPYSRRLHTRPLLHYSDYNHANPYGSNTTNTTTTNKTTPTWSLSPSLSGGGIDDAAVADAAPAGRIQHLQGRRVRHLLHLGNRLHVTANQYVEHHRDITASPPLSGRHLRVRVRREKWDVRWGDRLSLPEVGSGRVVGCWCWDEASPLGREKVRRNGSITMSQPGDGSLNRAPRSPVLPRNPNSSTRAVLAQSRRRCTTLRMVKAIVSVQGDLMLGGHSYTAGLAPATGGAIHIRSEERGNYERMRREHLGRDEEGMRESRSKAYRTETACYKGVTDWNKHWRSEERLNLTKLTYRVHYRQVTKEVGYTLEQMTGSLELLRGARDAFQGDIYSERRAILIDWELSCEDTQEITGYWVFLSIMSSQI
ncbi:hypothetical protein B0H34DRAFT_678057 [Crassisporium funariophilum]|nr:hypothetical protein B0H34DRAFT_678057 [Crassisporium funariophilum]